MSLTSRKLTIPDCPNCAFMLEHTNVPECRFCRDHKAEKHFVPNPGCAICTAIKSSLQNWYHEATISHGMSSNLTERSPEDDQATTI